MAVTITNVKYIESSDYEFAVSFIFDGRNLQTQAMARDTDKPAILAAIREQIADYKQKRSDNKYSRIRAEIELPELDV